MKDAAFERVRDICSALPNVTWDEQWDRIIFRIDQQPFAAYGGNDDFPESFHFRPVEHEIDELLGEVATIAFGQLTPHPWLCRDLSWSDTDWLKVERLIEQSYELALR